MYSPVKLAARIRDLRLAQGWSQEDLAIRLQLRGHATFYRPRQTEIELGIREVSVAELISYARVFGVRITDLLDENDLQPE